MLKYTIPEDLFHEDPRDDCNINPMDGRSRGERLLDNIREIHEGSYPIYRLLTLMKNHFRMAISLQSDVFQTISRGRYPSFTFFSPVSAVRAVRIILH